jgi:hypothetical protein
MKQLPYDLSPRRYSWTRLPRPNPSPTTTAPPPAAQTFLSKRLEPLRPDDQARTSELSLSPDNFYYGVAVGDAAVSLSSSVPATAAPSLSVASAAASECVVCLDETS